MADVRLMPAVLRHDLSRIDLQPGDTDYEPVACLEEAGVPVETVCRSRMPWIDGTLRGRRVRPGIGMHWGAERIGRETVYHSEPGPGGVLCFIFALEGGWRDVFQGREACERSSGQMSILNTAGFVRHHCLPSPNAWHLCIVVERGQVEAWFAREKTEGARRLLRLIRGEGAPHYTLPFAPGVRAALEAVRDCPYRGICRALALEARCNDLIVRCVEALSGGGAELAGAAGPHGDAVRIRAAAEVLDRNLENPPSLGELARLVGINECYLKRGFRQVFDTTPFGYLRTRRMERARHLLETGQATVIEASTFVGHRNPSHFASMFRRQFGANPHRFKRRDRP